MNGFGALRRHVWTLVLVAAMLLTAAPTKANAAGECAADADACLIVNTVRQTNQRDDVLTLREALLVTSGGLDRTLLTTVEQGQLHEATELGFAGYVEVNFDATVFPPGAGGVITLLPPGLGGGDTPGLDDDLPPGLGGGDGLVLALPPGLGGGDTPGTYSQLPPGLGSMDVIGGGVIGGGLISGGAFSGGLIGDWRVPSAYSQLPPGLGGVDAIGGGVIGGQRVPVDVTIDGGMLGSGYVGLWNGSGGTLRDLRFTNFAGHAIEVVEESATNLVLDNVTFQNNAADVVAVVSAE